MIDLENLKKLALAATPGPWYSDEPFVGTSPGVSDIVSGVGWQHSDANQCATARFIAAANPATVLELVERLEQAGQALDVAQERCNLLLDEKNEQCERASKAEERIAYLESAWHVETLIEKDNALGRIEAENDRLRQALVDRITKLEAKPGDLIIWNRPDPSGTNERNEVQRAAMLIHEMTGAWVGVMADMSRLAVATDDDLDQLGLMRKPVQGASVAVYDLSPVNTEAAIKEKLVAMGWTPPPEPPCPSSLHDTEAVPVRGPTVRICADRDRECGDRLAGWCDDCPKRQNALTQRTDGANLPNQLANIEHARVRTAEDAVIADLNRKLGGKRCKHGVILYGNRCISCEREGGDS
jgi:hypothetical protein